MYNIKIQVVFTRNKNLVDCYCRQPDLYEESPDSSEYSTGSTLLSQTAGDKMEESREELCALHLDSVAESQSTHIGDQIFIGDCENGILSGAITNQGNFILIFNED